MSEQAARDTDTLGQDLVDEIIEEEIAKLEGPECAAGAHVPEGLHDPCHDHCDRCDRSIHRDSAEGHFGGCTCVTCFPQRQARGYAAPRKLGPHGYAHPAERIFPEAGFVPKVGDWIWYSVSDGRAILGQVFGVRREGRFFDIIGAKPFPLVPTSVHRRYLLRAATAAETA